jgi:hypothetical protein
MNDVYISEKELSKRGVNAILGIGGGVALLVLSFVLGKLMPLVGLVLGGIVAALGISAVFSKHKEDRKGGLLTTAVGILLMLFFRKVPMVTAFAGTILSIGAIASFGLGIWNGIRFLFGMKSRR